MSVVRRSVGDMRILHTSDWHLGRTLHGVDLLDHQAAYLDHLVEVVRAMRVDAVLVAGDVYDRAVPPVPAVELLADALSRLAAHTRVVLTPGNHDSATRLGFGAGLFTERVSVRCRIADIARPVEIPDADGGTGALVYALPYLDPDTARHQLADAGPEGADDDGATVPLVPGRSHEAVLGAAMVRVRRDLAAHRGGSGSRVPAVVMAHAFVVGGQASESERDIRVGGVDSVPAGIFGTVSWDEAEPGDAPPDRTAGGDVDYLALGHLHGAQRIGSDDRGPVLRYAGSPLAYSFSERSQRKSSTVVELVDDGVRGVELVDAPVPRRLAEVVGTLEDLRGRAFDGDVEAWVRVVVTDDARPRDLYARVVERFPHALVIQHRPAAGAGALAAPRIDADHDPLEVAAQFVLEVGGRPATPEERVVLRDSYEAALAAGRSA